jgi:hypothetical protein
MARPQWEGGIYERNQSLFRHFCRSGLDGAAPAALQKRTTPNARSGLQVTSNVPCLRLNHNQISTMLPALWKTMASCINVLGLSHQPNT